MFKNLRLAQQMGLGFAAVLILLVAVSVTAFWAIRAAGIGLEQYETSVAATGGSWEQQDDVSQLRINVLSNLANDEARYIETALKITVELEGDMQTLINQAQTEAQKTTLTEMLQDVQQFAASFEQINDLWTTRNDLVAPMTAEGDTMVALLDEVIGDYTRDGNVTLLALAAKAQKALLFGRLSFNQYLEDPYEENYRAAAQALDDERLGNLIAQLDAATQDPEIKDDYTQFEAARGAYLEGLTQLREVVNKREGLIAHTVNDLGPELTHDLEKLKQASMDEQNALEQEAQSTSELGLLLVSVLSVVALVLGSAIALILPRAIRKPIGGEPKTIAGLTDRIAEGDLTVEFADTGKETGIYASMRGMTRQLTRIVGEVTDSAGTVSSASSQIAAGSQELSQRTEEQAASLEETAASVEEITSTIKQNADNAQEANQLAEGARDNALKGGEVVKRAQSAMDEISSASNQIKEIIEVIEGITFQTNLLSLNASVEAARAGEQGRGFAVVAGEVGKLASKSADAAKDIKGLINSTVSKVEAGAALVAESGSALEEIISSVNRVTDIVAEIAAASQEQATGISQVNKAITQMDEVTQHNSSLVEETASAAEALSEQANHLKELIGYFRITTQSTAAAPAADKPAAAPKPAPASRVSQAPASKSRTVSAGADDHWEDF